MALYKEIENKFGSISKYHKIIDAKMDLRSQSVTIEIASYIDSGKTSNAFTDKNSITVPLTEEVKNNLLELMYNSLKETSEFSDYKNV